MSSEDTAKDTTKTTATSSDLEFLGKAFKHLTGGIDYHGLAADTGSTSANNTQKKLKKICEKFGAIVPPSAKNVATGSDGAPKTPQAARKTTQKTGVKRKIVSHGEDDDTNDEDGANDPVTPKTTAGFKAINTPKTSRTANTPKSPIKTSAKKAKVDATKEGGVKPTSKAKKGTEEDEAINAGGEQDGESIDEDTMATSA